MTFSQPPPPPPGLPEEVGIAYRIALALFFDIVQQLQFQDVRTKHYPLKKRHRLDNFADSVSLSIVGVLLYHFGDDRCKGQPIYKIINFVIANFAVNGIDMQFGIRPPCKKLVDESKFDNFALKYLYPLLDDIQSTMLSRPDIYLNLEIPPDEINKECAGIWIDIVFGREISFLDHGIDINPTILKSIPTDENQLVPEFDESVGDSNNGDPNLPVPEFDESVGESDNDDDDWPVEPREPVAESDPDEDESPTI